MREWVAIDLGGVVPVDGDLDVLARELVVRGDEEPGFGPIPQKRHFDRTRATGGDVHVPFHAPNDATTRPWRRCPHVQTELAVRRTRRTRVRRTIESWTHRDSSFC